MSTAGLILFVLVAVYHTAECLAVPLNSGSSLKFINQMQIEEENGQHIPQLETPWFCHNLVCPAYTPMKSGDDYEAREYVNTHWFSTSIAGIDLSEAGRKMFMKLFDYIDKNNVKKAKIAMTAPVLIKIIPGQGPACEDNFTMSFFNDPAMKDPPKPTDSSIFFSELAKQKVYVKSFSGYANQEKWLKCAEELTTALIKDGKQFVKDYFLTAGYDSPFRVFERHNEVWFIAKEE